MKRITRHADVDGHRVAVDWDKVAALIDVPQARDANGEPRGNAPYVMIVMQYGGHVNICGDYDFLLSLWDRPAPNGNSERG